MRAVLCLPLGGSSRDHPYIYAIPHCPLDLLVYLSSIVRCIESSIIIKRSSIITGPGIHPILGPQELLQALVTGLTTPEEVKQDAKKEVKNEAGGEVKKEGEVKKKGEVSYSNSKSCVYMWPSYVELTSVLRTESRRRSSPRPGGAEAPPSQAAPEKGEPIPETETLATAHRVRPPTSLHCIQFDRAEQILPVDP